MGLTKHFARIAAVGAAACVLSVCMPLQTFALQSSGVIQVNGFEPAGAVNADTYEAMSELVTAAWDGMKDTADLTKLKIKRDDFKTAMRRLMMDTPSYFFVEHSYQFSYSSTTGYITKVYFTYNCTADELPGMRAAYEKAKQAILAEVDPAWSQVEKALYLHDAIVATTSYDLTYSNYDAYDVLVTKEAVCQGYALAYMDLMRDAGVDCYYLASDELNHAWNMVELDGSFYHVDATWDDPTPDQLGTVHHDNFLCTDEEIRALGHDATDWQLNGFNTVPEASDTKFVDSFWDDSVAPIVPIEGSWAAVLYDDVHNKGLINLYSYDSTDNTAEASLCTDIPEKWYVSGNSGSYWLSVYSGLGVFDGRLYYGTANTIYSILPDGSDKQEVYTLTAEEAAEGKIYGLTVDSTGYLRFSVNEKPNTEGTIYGIQLETSEGPDPVLGDLDQDGQVTVADMVLLRRFLIGKSDLTADVATVADLNADEKINAIDLVLIKYILLNPAE
ncbi:dockerin type I domain-containing protein [Ruminococcus sp.]|uniref:dockerin type I domain-containing protein n=1 Tax=Ruminococcus sp. TaxID=41978 RepID=UPI002624F760|nr:dockerin type I domain-containing protein [Ruminococcus sp.]MDD7556612.1 dockerin type I domain-containing protein [Ruminococcus sp.]